MGQHEWDKSQAWKALLSEEDDRLNLKTTSREARVSLGGTIWGGRRLMTKGIKEPQVSHCSNTRVLCPQDSFPSPACSSLRHIAYTETSCPEFQLLISASSNAGIGKKTYRQTISNCFWKLPFGFNVLGPSRLKPTVSSHPKSQGGKPCKIFSSREHKITHISQV